MFGLVQIWNNIMQYNIDECLYVGILPDLDMDLWTVTWMLSISFHILNLVTVKWTADMMLFI